MAREIPLTQGLVALVDDEDYELVSKYKWHAHKNRRTYYAEFTRSVNGKKKKIKMHRLILGASSGTLVDHRDGNGLNNTRQNMRFATEAQNAMNRRAKTDTRSGLKGTIRVESGWQARIKVDGKYVYLGTFRTAEEANAVYAIEAARFYGEFARSA